MTSVFKHTTAIGAALGVALGFGLSIAHAEETYPSKPVELVVGFGPGGPSGIAARFMQKRFEAVTGQELVIINKPGAGGAKAWSQINQDATDGYHLTLLNFPHTVLQPIARGANAGYTDDDIHPVLFYTSVPQVIAVTKDSPFTSFEELLAAMKASPGTITIAGTGVGGSNHSAFYKFTEATDVEAAYIPFKDTSSTITALKSGAVDAAWTFTTQGVRDGDTIRMLAIAAEERMPLFPDLPTMTELGYPMIDKAWWSIGVPPGTSDKLREMVSATFAKVVGDETVAAEMETGGYAPILVPFPDSKEFKAGILADYTAIGEALAAMK
ncbi:MAG: tripartite-type tricarboxylate transporter receptor subunit TctC [Yoonia sp.]|jgi:tripartite-type tricarboxylate transporter receptor subunit TctC